MTVTADLVTEHRPTLEAALTAIRDRGYWSAYPESARAYGEDGEATGRAAFEAYLGTSFPLRPAGQRRHGQHGDARRTASTSLCPTRG